MELKRTTVYADAEDLATIKEAARREGVAEAEIIRAAIHLAAQSKRNWGPLEWPEFSSADPKSAQQTDRVLEDVWDEKARAYEATKQRRR